MIVFLITMEARAKQKEEVKAQAIQREEVEEAKKRQYRENNILAKKFDLLADALIAL